MFNQIKEVLKRVKRKNRKELNSSKQFIDKILLKESKQSFTFLCKNKNTYFIEKIVKNPFNFNCI